MRHKHMLFLHWTACMHVRNSLFPAANVHINSSCDQKAKNTATLTIQKGERSVKTEHNFSFVRRADIICSIILHSNFSSTFQVGCQTLASPKTKGRHHTLPELLGFALWRLQDDSVTIYSYIQMDSKFSCHADKIRTSVTEVKWHKFNIPIQCKLLHWASYEKGELLEYIINFPSFHIFRIGSDNTSDPIPSAHPRPVHTAGRSAGCAATSQTAWRPGSSLTTYAPRFFKNKIICLNLLSIKSLVCSQICHREHLLSSGCVLLS